MRVLHSAPRTLAPPHYAAMDPSFSRQHTNLALSPSLFLPLTPPHVIQFELVLQQRQPENPYLPHP